MPSSLPFKVFMSLLQIYFLIMNVTVEDFYCREEITADSKGFLIQETYEFCLENNPYFLGRPEWLRQATCLHSKLFWAFYVSVLLSTIMDLWHIPFIKFFMMMSLGAKVYAVNFYHFMEFSSETPPPNLVPYFAAEGPYLVSMALVAYKLYNAETTSTLAVNTSSMAKAKAY